MEKFTNCHLLDPDYWDDLYKAEQEGLKNTIRLGDEWYEPQQNAILDWIEDNLMIWSTSICKVDDIKKLYVLDIGTGNGIFPHRLASLGLKHIHGTDYIESSIILARNYRESLRSDSWVRTGLEIKEMSNEYSLDIKFAIDDVASADISEPDSDESRAVTSRIKEKSYHIIHDKGTFDFFVLKEETKGMLCNLISKYMNKDSIYIVTTTNCTEKELIDITQSAGLSVVDLLKPSPEFTFGGVAGASSLTAVFTLA